MAQFTGCIDLSRPVEEIFAFFLKPAHLLLMKPADVHLELIDGPAALHLGARITWKIRRWGITRQLVHEMVEIAENRLQVERQIQGPFAHWLHTRRFEPSPFDGMGTRLTEEIAFAPPSGLLGQLLGEAKIMEELAAAFAHRERWLGQRFTHQPEA